MVTDSGTFMEVNVGAEVERIESPLSSILGLSLFGIAHCDCPCGEVLFWELGLGARSMGGLNILLYLDIATLFGASRVIQKPFTPDDIRRAVQYALAH